MSIREASFQIGVRLPVSECLNKVLALQALVNQEANRNCIGNGDSGCFGSSHDTAVDAAQDDDGHDQCRNRMNRLNGVDCSIIVNSLILC